MERLIRHTLETLANIAQSKYVTLLRVNNNRSGIVAGIFAQGKYEFPEKQIEFTGTLLEEVIANQKMNLYGGKISKTLILPTLETQDSPFNCLCMPLLNEERHQVIGIALLSESRGNLPPEHCLSALSNLIATTMDITKENERLYHLVTTDSLTELYTRNYFESRLQEEFTRVHRHGGIVSLLLIDVDDFKQINDSFGYQEGNQVLKEVARFVRLSVRQNIDLPCRYNGEQFMVMLPNTEVDGAFILAERIRQRCEKKQMTTLFGLPLKVTISVGVAHNVETIVDDKTGETRRIMPLTKDELLYRADLMLQAAKQAGKNKVMVWW